MHLYLEKKEKVRCLIIYLFEGHAPRIAGLSGPSTDHIISGLEPGIWFKVMILDKVRVNCNTQAVYWTVGEDKEDKNAPEDRQTFGSIDSYVYDFDDDMDELFKLADYLINTNPLAESDEELQKEKIQEYEQTLFRMLHCYILRKIQLKPEDQERVAAAYESQVAVIQQLEKETLVHSRLCEHYTSKKREILEKDILPSLDEYFRNGEVDKELLEVIVSDVNKAIPDLREKLDAVSKDVETVKEKCRSGDVSQWIFDDLANARKKRDTVSYMFSQYLTCRELIGQYRRGGSTVIPVVTALTPAGKLYLDFHKRIGVEKQKASALVAKKVLAASVRECLEMTNAALKEGEATLGDEVTTDGQRTTDVIMDVGSNPEWLTLSDRLATIVHNAEHPVGREFLSFTGTIKTRCENILKTFEGIINCPSSKVDRYLDYYVVSEEDIRVDKVILDDLRMEILLHFLKMSDLLVDFFKNYSPVFLNKVRLCYEKCFFYKAGEDLIRLYRLVYSTTMISLENRIKCLRAFPICHLGLQMKDEWWLSLLDNHQNDNNEEQLILVDSADSVDSVDSIGSPDTDIIEEPESDVESNSVERLRDNLRLSKEKVLSRSTGNILSAGNSYSYHPRDEADEMTKEIESRNRSITIASNGGSDIPDSNSDRVLHGVDEVPGIPGTGQLDRKRSASERFLRAENPISRFDRRRLSQNDSFQRHFGPTVNSIRKIFTSHSPLTKMQCLTSAIRLLVDKVAELRMRDIGCDKTNRSQAAVSADDLLPLVVLMLLKLQPVEAGQLFIELIYISDLMADFLSSGCHSFALTEFQIAFRVLDQTCEELEIA